MTADYVLREASQEEYVKINSINFEVWGHPLSLEDYLDRESTLAKVAKDERQSWVLLRGDEIVSSCETYRRPILAKIDGKIISGSSFGVASVYTPPQVRRNGYATVMMKMLYEKIFSGRDDLIGSHLYSDIGPKFYHKLGWNIYPSIAAEIDVKKYKSMNPKGLIHTISISDLDILLKNDVARLVTDDMKDKSFLLEPTAQSVRWLFARSVFCAERLRKPTVTSVGVGCDDAFLLWFVSFKENVLYIIRLHAPNNSNIPNLIEAAVGQANFYGLSKIVIWNPDSDYWSKLDSVDIVQREDSLSSMALQYKGSRLENYDWMLNEKYSWI